MSGASLSVPGVLHVGMSGEQDLAPLHVGPGVGWVALKGIRTWTREISVVLKTDVREMARRDLDTTLPDEHPEAGRLPNAQRAARAASLVAVESRLVDELVALGVRVHTIGSDHITGGFYYFAKGGAGEAVRVQGNLVEMVAPALAATADNAAIEACLDGLIGRVVAELSGGVLSEPQIELAAALPALGEAVPEAAAKLQTLEGFLMMTGARASKYEQSARAVVEALGQASRRDEPRVQVPLFGEARSVVQPELEIEYAEGESGARRKLTLPERRRWLVAGLISETIPPPAPAPAAADPKAEAEKAAAAKAAAEKAAAEKAAAERAAAQKAAENAAAEKAAAERAAAERAAAEKAERAAAEKAAAERAAAEKAAAEKALADEAAAERVAAEKAAAAEKAEAARLAEESVTAEKARTPEREAVRKADEKAAAEAEAEKKAEDRADREADTQKKKRAPAASEARKKIAAPAKAEVRRDAPANAETQSARVWLWIALVLAAAAGAYYFAFIRHG